uniref:Small ribosomal subunit protein bS6c n=1 Tax=Gracilaria vermiculophylla TaxID=2608709 RepID=A0A345U8P4_9FLOR|nr:ribosomal protein S6 [Gracilaria vermiculophylla]AXI96830.1 ribosomal protein S6 [Gracilaria vermiculophylla]QXU75044.1 ribosomal protein S6 [Gracilaria vermiculophylla]WDZ68020.1 ribosomal protein S6 [Gracilaria vermiculophylla]
MNLNKYETIYILKPNITESENLNLVNKYKSLIKKYGGDNILVQHKGRRHLNYNIKSYYDGIYVQINYHAGSNLVKILEKAMRLSDSIIRYLTIKDNSIDNLNI